MSGLKVFSENRREPSDPIGCLLRVLILTITTVGTVCIASLVLLALWFTAACFLSL